jgi:hypothetical protein
MDSTNLSLAQKIARRFQAELVGNPKELVVEFENILKRFEMPKTTLAESKLILEDPAMQGQAGARSPDLRTAVSISSGAIGIVKRGHGLISGIGHKLFLSILQTYTLPPALRKKIEIASRVYLKETRPRFKNKHGNGLYLEYIVAYEKYFGMLSDHLDFAKEAIRIGKEHAEEAPEGGAATKFKVGPFTVVNTGGFSDKQMAEVREVVAKAATLLQSSGLSQVCYGEIQVTNTLWKANVLAFYLVGKDEMFIRANVKANHDTVRTVLHELGHRFEHKFLKGGSRAVNQLYRLLSGQEMSRKNRYDESMVPKPGEKLTSKGKTYLVTKAVPVGGKEYKIYLQQEDDPKVQASISLEGWLSSFTVSRDVDADPNYIGFVSNYAKTGGPSENFAEMFAFYCMNKLPALQSAPFESIVFGDGKLDLAASVVERFRR